MSYSFHPSPITGLIKTALFALVACIILFLVRDFLKDLFLPLFGMVLLAAGFFAALAYAVTRFQTVTLDGKSVSYQRGILSLKKFILPYSKVTEANYSQSLVQRILGLGDLAVDSPGGSDNAIHMHDAPMADIKKVLAEIDKDEAPAS